ncbi:MAG: M20/M25/M40 family metallo-hydrolase [bacterium]|nr:MAG: M20/M25/M40 family metallo-hydrolase [bacterium]
MKSPFLQLIINFIILIFTFNTSTSQTVKNNIISKLYLTIAKAITDTAMLDSKAYSMLKELCYDIGPRLCGSPQAAAAVEWNRQTMLKLGFDNVQLQPVMVPHWERGKIEEAAIINSSIVGTVPLSISALGGSIGTPGLGITAEVIEVKALDGVKKLGKDAKGKIIFYNRPMNPRLMNTFSAYGSAVDQRTRGAIEAAKVGAVAVLVRSVTTLLDRIPHTGLMLYEENVPRIPAAAISTIDAELLSKLIEQEDKLRVRIRLDCKTYPDIESFNVIGEITGVETPNEIVLLGAHLDSWDTGHGAHDDGAGCIQAIEAVRLLKILNLKPKRTIRAVLFMCEEFGIRGGPAYADSVKKNGPKHIAAIESDRGGFAPRGFSVSADSAIVKKIRQWSYLFEKIGAANIFRGGGGPDISPLNQLGTVTMGLIVDHHRYFDYHHSANDIFETVNKRELELGAVAMAILSYVLAMEGVE